MTWLKYLIITILFFVFSLLQVSFFPYFAIAGAIPNLVFVLFFIIIFFEPPHSRALGISAAVMAGILSDMFLTGPFGISIAVFLVIYFLHALISHFLRVGRQNYLVVYFIGMFAVMFLVYSMPSITVTTFIGLVYGLVFALIGFYTGQKVFSHDSHNQLKLL